MSFTPIGSAVITSQGVQQIPGGDRNRREGPQPPTVVYVTQQQPSVVVYVAAPPPIRGRVSQGQPSRGLAGSVPLSQQGRGAPLAGRVASREVPLSQQGRGNPPSRR